MNSIFCWVSKLTVTKTRRKHQYGHKYGRPERDNLVRKETGKKKVSKIYFNKGNFCLKSASISDPFFFFFTIYSPFKHNTLSALVLAVVFTVLCSSHVPQRQCTSERRSLMWFLFLPQDKWVLHFSYIHANGVFTGVNERALSSLLHESKQTRKLKRM